MEARSIREKRIMAELLNRDLIVSLSRSSLRFTCGAWLGWTARNEHKIVAVLRSIEGRCFSFVILASWQHKMGKCGQVDKPVAHSM